MTLDFSLDRTIEIRATRATVFRFGDTYGFDELLGHIGAVHQFMPGAHLEARGTLRRSHDTALASWAITAGDKTLATGTNVIRFDSDAKIADVVGVGQPPP